MRRVAFICLALASVVLFITGSGSADGGDPYRVRAIFDNASFAAENEDVKVAGAVIGRIDSLELTDSRKAALTLEITDERFTPFHLDAHCTIRSEGVLAVKFIDCDPGTSASPELPTLEDGESAGEHLLSVRHTSSPVDLDIVTNTYRQPTGQQLALLINELGTGLAARGRELNEVIHRANPSLAETDRVLAILARENRELSRIAQNADAVLTPLAAEQEALAGFVTNAGRTAAATASRSDDIARGIERLPGFLRELRPAMAELGQLTEQAMPVLSQLEGAAPSLNRTTRELARFADEGVPAFRSLGRLRDQGAPDLLTAQPLINDLGDLGDALNDVGGDLDAVTTSFAGNDGIKHFLQLLFFGTSALNGFDELGHYVRVEALSGACSEYTGAGFFGCDAQWGPTTDAHGPITAGRPLAFGLKPDYGDAGGREPGGPQTSGSTARARTRATAPAARTWMRQGLRSISCSGAAGEPAALQARRGPSAGARDHGADRGRRRTLGVVQLDQGTAAGADVPAHGRGPECRPADDRRRRHDRRLPRRPGNRSHADRP